MTAAGRMAVAACLVTLLAGSLAAQEEKPAVTPEDLGRSDAMIGQALAFARAGRLAEAGDLFRKAIELNPSEPSRMKARAAEELKQAGVRLLTEDRLREGLACLEPALELDRRDHEIPYYMAQAEYVLAGRNGDRRRVDRARSLIAESKRRNDLFPDVWLFSGRLAMEVGDYETAVRDLEGALKRGKKGQRREARPMHAEALLLLGKRRFQDPAMDPGSLVALFEGALQRLEPLKEDLRYTPRERAGFRALWLECLTFLAGARQRASDLGGAEKILRRLIELEPENAVHYYNLGLLLGDMLAFDEAMKNYRKALELSRDPEWKLPYRYMAWIASRQGKREQAEEYFRIYIERYPEAWDGYFYRGDHHLEGGEAEKAVADYRRCVELAPRRLPVMEKLAAALGKAGRPAEAAKWTALVQAVRADQGE